MGGIRRIIRVVDGDGIPLADAMIAVEASDVPFPEIALVTDANGRVTVTFPPGHYRIAAHDLEGRHGSLDTEILQDNEEPELMITVRTSDQCEGC